MNTAAMSIQALHREGTAQPLNLRQQNPDREEADQVACLALMIQSAGDDQLSLHARTRSAEG